MPYKNSEKRKEKSRDAARSRRGKESEVFSELSMHLPVSPVVLSTLDKASTMRVAISHLKLRKLLGPAPCEHPSGVDHMIDRAYMQSLNGFLMVLARDGDIVYLSENCSQHLGLSQIELIGQSMFDFIHMSDRATVREVLEKATPKHKETEFDFFVRLKCTLTSKGKNINLKSATFKVLHCTGRCVTVKETADDKGITCLIVVAEPIPHPVNIEIFLDSNTHLTTHNLDMSIQFCDAKLCKLLGFTEEEMTQKSMYDLYHAADIQRLHTSFKLMKEMGQIKTGVYRLLAKGGGYVYVDTEATIICNVHTGAEEHIVCVNYIISGVEEPNLILADFQMADFQMSSTCVPVDEMIPAAAIKEDTDDVILSTESIFSSLTTHDDPSIADDSCYATQAPSAGDVMVALDYNNQDPKLVGVESLLLRVDPASGEELLTSPPYSASSESIMPQSTVPSDVDTPPGLVDLISDSDTESSSSQTLIIDPEEVDMCQRAPYISMSGDDDLMFPMETSGDTGMEELSVGANVMLGRTESVFNSMPTEDEEEDEEGSHKSHNVPFPILRQLATHSKKREYSQGNQHSPAKPLSTPTETNRLETGPPHPTKRVRLSSDANSGMCVSEKSADLSAVGGSSVLMNLLLCGEDVQNGYSIPPPLPKPPSPAQSMSSLSSSASSSPVSEHGGTLRDLLTCPLEPSLSSSCASSPTSSPSPKIYPATASSTVINSPSAKQYITFDPAIMKVLGLTTNSSSAL